jgi:hypothetical protein
MNETTLWKGLGAGFSPDPVLVDDLLGKRIRKLGHKGSRTRGKCTFASASRDQAEDYADGPESLVQVQPDIGAVMTWSPDAGDLILDFESFLRREQWDDMAWASQRARDIIIDVAGCVATFEQYIRIFPRSRALPQIVDEFLGRISVREITFLSLDQLSDALEDHDGEVWITGPCILMREDGTNLRDTTTPLAA